MTGSALAPVVIPVVAFVFLFLWIALVFHANAHPSVHRHADQAGHEDREAPRTRTARRNVREQTGEPLS